MKSKLLPCPCCGNANLYTGPMGNTLQGVECSHSLGGCGLSITVGVEIGWAIIKKGTMEKAFDAAQKEAVKRWNRRDGIK